MLRCEIDIRGMNYVEVYALQVNEGMVLCKCVMARIISILLSCVQIEYGRLCVINKTYLHIHHLHNDVPHHFTPVIFTIITNYSKNCHTQTRAYTDNHPSLDTIL